MATILLRISKIKGLRDVVYSVCGLLFFNFIVQFVIYPILNAHMGSNNYGIALSMLSVIAITAGSVGNGTNYARMINQEKSRTNGDYNTYLLMAGVLCVLAGTIYLLFIIKINALVIILYAALMFMTMVRYYADVDFRLRIDFVSYLIYYLMISAGYCLGLVFYYITKQWMVVLITGEFIAFLFIYFRGTIFKRPFFKRSENYAVIYKSATVITLSNIISNIIFNADKVLILFFLNGTAVTIFYVASLLGKTLSMLTQPINSVIISHLVRFKGKLTKKLFLQIFLAICALSCLAFIACIIVAPWLIHFLYPREYKSALPIMAIAILGQVVFFASDVLLTILLRFFGEKYLLYINSAYAASYIALAIPALAFCGLTGFAYAVLIINSAKIAACFIFILFKIGEKRNYIGRDGTEGN